MNAEFVNYSAMFTSASAPAPLPVALVTTTGTSHDVPSEEFCQGGDNCDKEVHDDQLVELSSHVRLPALQTDETIMTMT